MDELTPPRLSSESEPERKALESYYIEKDFLLSPEGILKALSVVVCIISSVLYLSAGGTCGGAPGLALSATTVALVGAAGMALLYAGTALAVPLYAPQLWLFTDIIASTVMGVLLLLTSVLSVIFCNMDTVIAYLHAPLGVLAAGMIIGSAGLTYSDVTRRWDAARPAVEPPRPAPTEQDV